MKYFFRLFGCFFANGRNKLVLDKIILNYFVNYSTGYTDFAGKMYDPVGNEYFYTRLATFHGKFLANKNFLIVF